MSLSVDRLLRSYSNLRLSSSIRLGPSEEIVPDATRACTKCTFLNVPHRKHCAVCEQPLPTVPAATSTVAHTIYADRSWRCGQCDNHNAQGVRDCYYCAAPYVSVVTCSVPLHDFGSPCGVHSTGTATQCSASTHRLHSTMESFQREVVDTTSVVARDLGLHVRVRCPGCLEICHIPSAACFRCATCHIYFAAPTVGAVTSFHAARLARSVSSSLSGLFKSSALNKGTSFAQSVASFFADEDDSSSSDDEDDEPIFDEPPKVLTMEEDVPIGVAIPGPVAPPTARPFPPPALRKSQSAPATLPPAVCFEKDWDLKPVHDDLATDSEDEEKEELSDEMQLRALRRSYREPLTPIPFVVAGDTIDLH
ncbi:hypothetical protein ACHHYP_11675 [Achlya hypogyna]|uniref:RanBP2-type domain-containing protein n=1 Tax=Achlya hypogyna TaxID=1202772 RepID=A0A1V9YIU7_ACHHY|nr:hypothetical protein ACHHYP_11675 [Achlya hypogyna]